MLSRFTAFVAVDRAAVVNPGAGKQVTQAVEQPAGWEGAAAAAGPAGMPIPMPRSAPPLAGMPPMAPMASMPAPAGGYGYAADAFSQLAPDVESTRSAKSAKLAKAEGRQGRGPRSMRSRGVVPMPPVQPAPPTAPPQGPPMAPPAAGSPAMLPEPEPAPRVQAPGAVVRSVDFTESMDREIASDLAAPAAEAAGPDQGPAGIVLARRMKRSGVLSPDELRAIAEELLAVLHESRGLATDERLAAVRSVVGELRQLLGDLPEGKGREMIGDLVGCLHGDLDEDEVERYWSNTEQALTLIMSGGRENRRAFWKR